MSYLIDTNVISELVRPRPAARVVEWFRAVPASALHLSVLSLGEIRRGVELLGNRVRKERLRVWLEQNLPEWFGDRILGVTVGVADRWGRLLAQAATPLPAVDSLLAATALHHGLRMVTHNTADFRFAGLDVVDPWSD